MFFWIFLGVFGFVYKFEFFSFIFMGYSLLICCGYFFFRKLLKSIDGEMILLYFVLFGFYCKMELFVFVCLFNYCIRCVIFLSFLEVVGNVKKIECGG